MKNGSGHVKARFRTPTLCEPKAVAAAREEFDRVGTAKARVDGERHDAREAAKLAPRHAGQAAADALLAGEEPPDPATAIQDAERRVTALTETARGFEQRLDEVGNSFAAVIAESAPARIEELRALEAAAVARFDAATEEHVAALAELSEVRSSREWLEAFDLGLARAAEQREYFPLDLKVNRSYGDTENLGGEHTVRALLEKAAAVTAPTEPVPVYLPRSEKEARFQRERSFV